MKELRRERILWLFAALFLAAPGAAAVSRLINFQGRVTDLSGTPIATATTLVFRLYNASSGGSALFTESQAVTPDADGLYSVNIGNVASLGSMDFGQDLWLSVEVNGELLPGRYQLTASPYAIHASSAALAAAAPWSGLTGVPGGFADGTDDTTPATGAVGSAQILDGDVAAVDLATSAVTSAKVLDGTLVNADVSASAAIAYSKLNLAGSLSVTDLASGSVGGTQIIDSTVTAADLASDAVTSAKVLDGTLLNADVNASAAIAYSKLNLTGGVVDADVSSSAEIAANKINGGPFQNESYVFPAGAAIGGSTITSAGNLQMPSGATITVGSVTGTLLPSGTMVLSIAACPGGFTEYTNARGFYLVGMPSGGTAAGTVGSAMTNLADAAHSHAITTSMVNNLTALGGTSAVASVTSPSGTAARSGIAPYIQVRLCVAP